MTSTAADQESQRLAALNRYMAVDWAGDDGVTGVTSLAAQLLDVPFAAVGLVERDVIRFVAQHGFAIKQIERTPGLCDRTIQGAGVHHVPNAAASAETTHHPLVTGCGVKFYAGSPLRTPDGFAIGVLSVLGREARELAAGDGALLEKLASLVMTQLEMGLTAEKVARLEHDQRLLREQLERANTALIESEDRFRDLFDEAPIAYVHEDLDSRFIRANHTAIRTLGLKPEEAVGTLGKTLVAKNPEAQRQVEQALSSIGSGKDTSGVVLELRRKDNGKPVWIQWWSRPAPDGSYTRTMFIDITDLVLMERQKSKLEAQNIYLQEEITRSHFDEIVGDSTRMRQVFADVEQVAPTPASVLILGETGTGKELIARAVHNLSQRAGKPLIKVNCSALPASLIESELFGHEKGAFTGATAKRVGRFALADGGTIFLDEIGDLPIDLQAKLLRVLQEGQFEPLGSSVTCQVDVRVIAATNRDLAEAIENGEFREDLYFRLAVFPIHLPPLRERLEDLASLACLFARHFAERLGYEPVTIGDSDIARLSSYSWPGNVRELRNVIERALITSESGALNLDRALPESASRKIRDQMPSETSQVWTVEELQQFERDNLERALNTANWQIAGKGGAAELLGMNPTTLTSRLKALKIRRPHH